MIKELSPGIELNALSKAAGLRDVGPEIADGVATTHVAGSVSREQLIDAVTDLTSAERAELQRQDQATSAQGAFVVDRHYSDYGTAVGATTPDAADTIDLAAAIKAFGGGASGGGTGGSI